MPELSPYLDVTIPKVEISKSKYSLKKALNEDLSKFIGQKNTEHTRLQVAETIRKYQFITNACGYKFDEPNKNGRIYASTPLHLDAADGTLSTIYSGGSNDSSTSSMIFLGNGTNDTYINGTAWASNDLDSTTRATTNTATNYKTEVLGEWNIEWNGSITQERNDITSSIDYGVGDTTVRFMMDGSGAFEIVGDLSFKQKFKNNMRVNIKSRANVINKVPKNEQVAIETLREMISETEFRKYIKYGFVLVKGKSGNTYQVFRNRSHTKVWRNGKVVEEVCVRIKSSAIPPTDNVIAFKTMIEADEDEFKKVGNIYKMIEAA